MPVRKILLLTVAILLNAVAVNAATNADYTHTPIYMSNDITPNVMILLDNSASMNDMAYKDAYDTNTTYYGYFSSDLRYSWVTNKFEIDATGDWSGNFLNWATMRRIDVARKVMMGGLATSRTGGGNQTNYGESPSGWTKYKWGQDSDAATLAPYVGSRYAYKLNGGNLEIWDGIDEVTVATYTIAVQKDSTQEPDDFVDGNLAGVMQKVADKARWGLAFFNEGPGSTESCHGSCDGDGGYVAQHITATGYGTNFITDLQNTPADTWTPLAEALYQVAGYYAQSSSIRWKNGNYSTGVQGKDPFYFDEYSAYVSCPKNFVLIITDGAPSYDSNIPPTAPIGSGNLQDYDGDGDTAPTGGSYTSDYLDDVAMWAHLTDLRSDITDNQTLTIYTVFAFGDDATAEQLLKDTAKNGAFTDSNDSGTPDVDSEWDSDGDGIPDTYFQASDGASLETELMAAISDILQRATSGTALSVLATSASGAGNVYQAYFLPSKTIVESTGSRDVDWLGHLMSLNVDSYGHLRDASNNCLAFNFDSANNETMVQTLGETSGVCNTTISSEVSLSDWTGYNWDAGNVLAGTAYGDRNIYTFVDADENGTPATGEVVALSTLSSSNIGYLGAANASEALDTVNFVLGEARTGLRDRTDEDGNEWKLGDIIHSTPTVVGTPQEAYGLLYQDETYSTFFGTHSGRDTMVYVGANDGILHAFNDTDGSEKWGYVPYNLLPHLRWLKSTTYSHVYYMDAKTKASDVQVFTCDSTHTGSNSESEKCWGTMLLAGMRMGGGQISDDGFDVDGDGNNPASKLRNFISSYVALDITDASATSPTVMWEFGHNLDQLYAGFASTDSELGFTMSYPAIVKMGANWFAIFGSGSDAAYTPDYNGDTTNYGKVFAVNIQTGALVGAVQVTDGNSVFSDPVAVDLDFNTANTATGATNDTYNTEVIYIGETYYSGSSYKGRMWRISTDSSTNPYDWDATLLFNTNAGEAIASAPAVATDDQGNTWVYFGTGRYYSDADKSDSQRQTFYGIKDPCWNGTTGQWDTTCLASASSISDTNYNSPSVANSNSVLINATNAQVFTDGTVTGVTGGVGSVPTTFGELETLADDSQGWYMTFPDDYERNLNKPTIIGGLVLFTSFIPSSDVCGYGGNSYFYSLYYKTGTAYSSSSIGTSSSDEILRRSEESSTGMGSAVAVHSGRESGGKAYVQYSTGEASAVDFESAIKFKSKIISWKEL